MNRSLWLLAIVSMLFVLRAASGQDARGKIFRHPEGHFSIEVPDGWKIDPGPRYTSFERGNLEVRIGVWVGWGGNGRGASHEDNAGIMARVHLGRWKEYKEGPGGPYPLGKLDNGKYKLYTGLSKEGTQMKLEVLSASDAQNLYVMMLSGPLKEWGTYNDDWHQLLTSFDVRGGAAAPARTTSNQSGLPDAGPLIPSEREAVRSQVSASPRPEPKTTGVAASTYRDPRGRFQVPVPVGWTAEKAGEGARISRGSTYANVLVVDGSASPSALIQQISQQVGGQWRDFRLVQNGQWNLGGLPAEYGVYTGTNPKGVPALLRTVATSGFVLLMSVPQNDWEAFKTDLRQIEVGFSTGQPGGAVPSGRASLGVTCHDVNTAEMWESGGATKQGAVVVEIGSGSPAEKAGFRIGDTIIALDRQAVKGGKDLVRLMGAHQPGDMVEIVVVRGGKPVEFMVTLAGRP